MLGDIPLVRVAGEADPIAWRAGNPISRSAFLNDARSLASRLPERSSVVNACRDRYNFLVAFAAAMLRGQVTLLPGDRSERVLSLLAGRYPGLYSCVDAHAEGARLDRVEEVRVEARGEDSRASGAVEKVPADRVVAIVFTSGTTGTPTANEKCWGTLCAKSRIGAEYMGMEKEEAAPVSIVATVPPQHMYGLETSVMVPLHQNACVHAGQPLLPSEIAAALASMSEPRILVATPYHLRALARARVALPPVRAVVSATAPLTAALAAEIEGLCATRVLEIYGFTEAGLVAARRTVEGATWRCHPEFLLRSEGGRFLLRAPHLDEPVPIPDDIGLLSEGTFEFCGRANDFVDMAGKRASLSGLNAILTEIDGVLDGAFFQPRPRDPEGVSRLVAIVVAPGVGARAIRDALRRRIDTVFLPRRICHVEKLPRTGSGKLPREAIEDLARSLGLGDGC